jgi:UDP-glucose 4-epimerase
VSTISPATDARGRSPGAPLEIHGDGNQTRCFCHVQDTVRALKALMASGVSGEIFNVGSHNRISILELANRVIEETGSTSEVGFVPYEDVYGQGIEDMIHRIPAIEKVREAVGWEPQRTLDDILADVIAHLRAEPVTA